MGTENKRGRKKKEIDRVFSERLTHLLQEAKTDYGTILEDVASEIGVSRQALGKWANGDTVPDILDLRKLSDYFGVSTDYLVGITDIETLRTDMKAICEYTGLSEASIEEISHDIAIHRDQKNISAYSNLPDYDFLKKQEQKRADIYNSIIENGYLRSLVDELYDLETKSAECISKYLIDWLMPGEGCSAMAEALKIDKITAIHCAEVAICMQKDDYTGTDLLDFESKGTRPDMDYIDLRRYRANKITEEICDRVDHRNDYKNYSMWDWYKYLCLTPKEIEVIKSEEKKLTLHGCKTTDEIENKLVNDIKSLCNKILNLRNRETENNG